MISEQVKARNDEYYGSISLELQRRKDAGLIVVSNHSTGNHWETQDEFRRWFTQTFPKSTMQEWPMWVSGRSGPYDGWQRHEWLMADPKHVFVAKLRWAK